MNQTAGSAIDPAVFFALRICLIEYSQGGSAIDSVFFRSADMFARILRVLLSSTRQVVDIT
jgi:hypothetical protein